MTRNGATPLAPPNLRDKDVEIMDAVLRRIGSDVFSARALEGRGAAAPGGLALLNHSCAPNAALRLLGPEALGERRGVSGGSVWHVCV